MTESRRAAQHRSHNRQRPRFVGVRLRDLEVVDLRDGVIVTVVDLPIHDVEGRPVRPARGRHAPALVMMSSGTVASETMRMIIKKTNAIAFMKRPFVLSPMYCGSFATISTGRYVSGNAAAES